jgi:hypothetical protein
VKEDPLSKGQQLAKAYGMKECSTCADAGSTDWPISQPYMLPLRGPLPDPAGGIVSR